jgi:hypothetical protein
MATLLQSKQKTLRRDSETCSRLNRLDNDSTHTALLEQALQLIKTLPHGHSVRWILQKMTEFFELTLERTTKMRSMGDG